MKEERKNEQGAVLTLGMKCNRSTGQWKTCSEYI